MESLIEKHSQVFSHTSVHSFVHSFIHSLIHSVNVSQAPTVQRHLLDAEDRSVTKRNEVLALEFPVKGVERHK